MATAPRTSRRPWGRPLPRASPKPFDDSARALATSTTPPSRFNGDLHDGDLPDQGESLQYVKEQMGHASIQTTVDIYGHLVPGANRQAVNGLDDADDPGLRLATG